MSLKPNIKVGDRFKTNNCGWCTVVAYNLYPDITVEFDPPYISTKRTSGSALKTGCVHNDLQPLQNSPTELHEAFYYDETSPSCLRWKVDIYSGNKHVKLQVSANDVVGTLSGGSNNGDLYYKTRFNGRGVLCHRAIWEMFNGVIQDRSLMIDHIDGDTLNNRIGNLRLVTRTTNMRNTRQSSINQSGVTGVKLQENTDRKGQPYYYYVAFWRNLNGTESHKCFSVSKLGDAEAFRLACEYRTKMIEELNSQGAGYTERHGT